MPLDAPDGAFEHGSDLAAPESYLEAAALRAAIEAYAAEASTPPAKRAALALRGSGEPEDGDVLYGSIRDEPASSETVVGLQEKLLFLLAILQGADSRPTEQARAATERLEETLAGLKARWEALR